MTLWEMISFRKLRLRIKTKKLDSKLSKKSDKIRDILVNGDFLRREEIKDVAKDLLDYKTFDPEKLKEAIKTRKTDLGFLKKEISAADKYKLWRNTVEYDWLKKKGFFDVRYYSRKIKKVMLNEPEFIARFQMNNGKDKQLICSAMLPFFEYSKKSYLIDPAMFHDDETLSMKYLNYREDFALPIDVSINSKDLHTKMEESDNDVKMSVDPSVLSRFIKSEFVQKILSGAKFQEEMAFIKIMMIVICGILIFCTLFSFIAMVRP